MCSYFGPGVASYCAATCNDGVLAANEECDPSVVVPTDANLLADGCTGYCQVPLSAVRFHTRTRGAAADCQALATPPASDCPLLPAAVPRRPWDWQLGGVRLQLLPGTVTPLASCRKVPRCRLCQVLCCGSGRLGIRPPATARCRRFVRRRHTTEPKAPRPKPPATGLHTERGYCPAASATVKERVAVRCERAIEGRG